MEKIFLLFLSLLFAAGVVNAEVVVEPRDMAVILKAIAARQGQVPAGQSAARVVIKDGQIVFLQQSGDTDIAVSFSDTTVSIVKQVNLRNNNNSDTYSFAAILKNNGQPFQHEVKKIKGRDALVFFNDSDVFVYTQTSSGNGTIELKEWIYARKPNAPHGSQWTWVFKSAVGDWPLTLGLGKEGRVRVLRNLPIAGVPISAKARLKYLLKMMVKFSNGDHVEKFFPFHETISVVPPAEFWTSEGVSQKADISVSNSSMMPSHVPGASADIDLFKPWDNYWQSFFSLFVPAQPSQYPLLIDPALVMGDKDVK